jgi:deoxyribonuclease V
MMACVSGSDDPSPIAIVDVGYGEQQTYPDGPGSRSPASEALAACVVAQRWADAEPIEVKVVTVGEVRPYEPGRFYERELPCVLAVLERLRTAVEVIVVDGYVILDEQGSPGLGGHLHAHLGPGKAMVGVAKTAYRGSTFATAVLRGASRRPLYVTAMGMEVEPAARLVASMHGSHRIPTLLGLVDRLARGVVSADTVAMAT